MTYPVKDPNSTKYPDRIFYEGRWRTPEQVELVRKRNRERYSNEPKYRERQLRRNRTESMSPEQIERKHERNRKYRAIKEQKESAKRQRLAKLSLLAENPGAAPAEREIARQKLSLLNERMIHELGQRH